jgi:hypothetical protein
MEDLLNPARGMILALFQSRSISNFLLYILSF